MNPDKLQDAADDAYNAAHIHMEAMVKLQADSDKAGFGLSGIDFQKIRIEQKGWHDEMEKYRIASAALLKLMARSVG